MTLEGEGQKGERGGVGGVLGVVVGVFPAAGRKKKEVFKATIGSQISICGDISSTVSSLACPDVR